MDDTIRRLRSLDGVEILVGVQGVPATGEHSMGELATIAARHEFGVGVPMRPFMRTSLKTHVHRWARGLRQAVRRHVNGDKVGATRVLRLVGLKAVGDVQATIRDFPWAPNSQATITAKGSDKPLIDSGQLRQSIRAAIAHRGRTLEVVA